MPTLGRNLSKLLNSNNKLTDEDLGTNSISTYVDLASLPDNPTAGTKAYVTATSKFYLWTGTSWRSMDFTNATPSSITGINNTYTLSEYPETIVATATDADGTPLTWSWAITSGSLTNGGGITAHIANTNNTFIITGTSTPAYAGTFDVTFSVTDNIANAVTFTSTITCNGS